jgi:hypothetical protein
MKESLASMTILALLLVLLPAPAVADVPGARLEGLLLDLDGRPAAGHRVHLIDERGAEVGRAAAAADGLYAFRDLPAGSYSLGIETGDGRMTPVAAPPVRIAAGQLARRDVKLVLGDESAIHRATGANYGIGMWWAGLSTAAKIWTIVGIVVVGSVTFAALDDDDESAASKFLPTP